MMLSRKIQSSKLKLILLCEGDQLNILVIPSYDWVPCEVRDYRLTFVGVGICAIGLNNPT